VLEQKKGDDKKEDGREKWIKDRKK